MMMQPPEPVVADPPALPGATVLRQRWAELAYFHWPYDPQTVQRLLPEGVRIDTFDGAAWVGLIPFVMRDVRLGPTPAVPYFGTFVEINVRTYVVDPLGHRAVWFFSLDVPRAAIVAIARTVFALPYCWSRTVFDSVQDRRRYRMVRRWPRGAPAVAEIDFAVGEPMSEVGELDHFLTARWGLLTTRCGRLLHGRVSHPRWPLHHVASSRIRQDVVEASGLPSPSGEPRCAWSHGVDVDVGWLDRVTQ